MADAGVICFWILCALALVGAFTQLVRAAPPWVWALPLLLWLTVVLVNAETPRFREPIDPFLILSAACALAAARRRCAAGSSPPVGRRVGRRYPLFRASLSRWSSAWPEPYATHVSGDSAENTGIPVSFATRSRKPRISVPPPASRIPSRAMSEASSGGVSSSVS